MRAEWAVALLTLTGFLQGCSADSREEEDPLDHMVLQDKSEDKHIAEQRD